MNQIHTIKKHFENLGYHILLTQHPDYYKEKSQHAFKHLVIMNAGANKKCLKYLCIYYFGNAEQTTVPGAFTVPLNNFKAKGHGRTGICKKCGCTDGDCSQCIKRTGEQCHWVEDDLCSACVPQKKEA
jgi:hypothetical protein